jgi:hypothetical protein
VSTCPLLSTQLEARLEEVCPLARSVPPKCVTVDAGREAQQNRADVEAGLKTITDHYAELGADFREEVERRGADAKLILETAAKYGVPVEMLWKPS